MNQAAVVSASDDGQALNPAPGTAFALSVYAIHGAAETTDGSFRLPGLWR